MQWWTQSRLLPRQASQSRLSRWPARSVRRWWWAILSTLIFLSVWVRLAYKLWQSTVAGRLVPCQAQLSSLAPDTARGATPERAARNLRASVPTTGARRSPNYDNNYNYHKTNSATHLENLLADKNKYTKNSPEDSYRHNKKAQP